MDVFGLFSPPTPSDDPGCEVTVSLTEEQVERLTVCLQHASEAEENEYGTAYVVVSRGLIPSEW
jgi:hypothetical protein